MEANELRIGNCILDPFGQRKIVSAIELDINDFSHLITLPNGEYLRMDEIRPIPLSEEWLLKFGFDLIYKNEFRKVYDFSKDLRFGYLDNFGLANIESSVTFVGYSFNEIKHVHQLQNLYFALTGKELELKETP